MEGPTICRANLFTEYLLVNIVYWKVFCSFPSQAIACQRLPSHSDDYGISWVYSKSVAELHDASGGHSIFSVFKEKTDSLYLSEFDSKICDNILAISFGSTRFGGWTRN